MISLDTETSGLDIRHGAKPYLVTTCNEGGENIYWEWEVNPLTREPKITQNDLFEIEDLVVNSKSLILQNPKFDVAALDSIGFGPDWPWGKTWDTLTAGHLLSSNTSHRLDDMALMYLGVDVKPFEDRVKEATQKARRLARKHFPDWRIASKDLPEMPSAKSEPWKSDMWLPRAICRWAKDKRVEEDIFFKKNDPKTPWWFEYSELDHPWWEVCAEYANSDSTVTLALFKAQKEELKKRGLWKIYLERLKVLPVVYQMEETGITLNRKRLEKLQETYTEESAKAGEVCMKIAKSFGVELSLPKSGNNKSLVSFVFDTDSFELRDEFPSVPPTFRGLGLQPLKRSKKTGAPALDKETLDHFKSTLPLRSRALRFIQSLSAKRSRDTAINYMTGYQRFWLRLGTKTIQYMDWYRLHPSLNPTGTNTLRWSSSNPNEQNISKKEGFNLRYCFGPASGREWWALDYNNLELRIPAYESNEKEMIALFERPDEPPYFGSQHLLVCDILHPKKFAECLRDGVSFKDRYKTLYGYTKNGNFAVQYGAIAGSGTADRAYHVKGGQAKVEQHLKQIKKLNRKMIAQAERTGYVETIPDKNVDPERGYPILCTRSKWGKISPTIPLSYHVQSTACWCIMKAMLRVYDYLQHFNDAFLIIQVHDEIVLDFPKGGEKNKDRILKIQQLMEESGDDIGIPLTTSISFHPNSWAEESDLPWE